MTDELKRKALSDEQVAEVLQMLHEGKSQARVAEHFGVSRSAISDIALRKTRTSVPGPRPEKRIYISHRTGDRGVSKHGNKWVAKLKLSGRMLYLGVFGFKSDAVICWNTHVAYMGLDRPLNEITEYQHD
jgi:hypothetical protein